MNETKTMTSKCPYCQVEVSIVNFSYRAIPGYTNPVTQKNVAFIEHLACGHEFVDGKFNVDKLFFSAPSIPAAASTTNNATKVFHTLPKYVRPRQSINIWDFINAACLIVNVLTCPILAVFPIVYFLNRIISNR